jgi:catechol 2,3-dioxygenase-like lactoylglutathione lyase family enzyme
MLTQRPITPILPVSDLERAKEFYEDKLGLHEAQDEAPTPEALVLEGGGGTKLEIERFDDPSPAEHTAVSFEVDDLEHEIEDLENRGVTFEDYDLPGLKTENHIAQAEGMKAAWFKDPDGNILCIHQRAA